MRPARRSLAVDVVDATVRKRRWILPPVARALPWPALRFSAVSPTVPLPLPLPLPLSSVRLALDLRCPRCPKGCRRIFRTRRRWRRIDFFGFLHSGMHRRSDGRRGALRRSRRRCHRAHFRVNHAGFDGAHCTRWLHGNALVCRGVSSHPADGGADRTSGLVFRNRLGQDQFRTQAKGSGQPHTAIDNGDGHRVVAVVSFTANVKDQLGRRQIFAIDQNQVEALRIEHLGRGDSVQRPLAGH